MTDKKTKLNCNLVARGSDKVKSNVADDLNVPDPEPAIGKQIIDDAMDPVEDGEEDDGLERSS